MQPATMAAMGTPSQSAPRDGRQAVRKRILIIEDDKDVRGLLRYDLEREGFRVSESEDGLDGLALVRKSPPDLLVLDLMLPRLSGLEICKQIRREQTVRRMPILVLTARSEEPDRIVGLELGADDYVTKPFSPRELVARIKALLRRSEPAGASNEPLRVGPLVIDPAAYRVLRHGRPLEMSALEFRLLHFLASHPNRAFSRDQLLEAVWGADRFVIPRIVDVYVRHLREKIEDEPNRPVRLKTVRSVGYLWRSQPPTATEAQWAARITTAAYTFRFSLDARGRVSPTLPLFFSPAWLRITAASQERARWTFTSSPTIPIAAITHCCASGYWWRRTWGSRRWRCPRARQSACPFTIRGARFVRAIPAREARRIPTTTARSSWMRIRPR